MKGQLRSIRNRARERPISVLPQALEQQELTEDPWQIANVDQLLQWTQNQPEAVLAMINDLRFDRDQFLAVGLQYEKMDARFKQLQDKLDEAQDMIDHWKEKALNKTQKHHLQDMAAATLDDDPQELKGSAKSPVLTPALLPTKAGKSTRMPDPDLFTDGPTWDDWSNKVLDKLMINEDHYPTERSRIVYIVNRLGGDAAKLVHNCRQINSPNAYLTADDVMEDLADSYKDIDRTANASREYKAMRHDTALPFRDFFPY